ncbi:Rieske [2Fe-2S] domain protein [Bacteriovorax sp. BSW11_IV]|uniref:aromatic ring-hydroxylating oxygenase subunit alpha n=1 Tax=Bacteriovorax sp. BSW11_IV TaxID=1353529 RepID=UPI000389E55E|nr:aromatic ring-hydroxylating dioxygenase subunit alpha [Bacteriovorax sp. BSW11_IV]EQC50128.1 Rieske [2Fe-2S] domain protein [Bacteriovorax sp. BSW11_IV]
MSNLQETKIFNNKEAIIEGWYWALQSKELKIGKVVHADIMGKKLAIYRGKDGRPRALDAFCPHMGAHLAEGKVEGNELRCFFHHWKFSEKGELNDIPCRKSLQGVSAKIDSYPVEEKFGLIWIWTGKEAKRGLPYAPELKDLETDSLLGKPYIKECHPNVMMINAIDAHHFASVHKLPVDLNLVPTVIDSNTIEFSNITKVPNTNLLTKFIGKFYKGPLTYSLCYHNATTGTVTLGPDFLHFYIMFAIRTNKNGQAEGQTILLTKKRNGLIGKIFNAIVLRATRVVGNYFAKGDTEVFKTINFKFKTPIKEDYPIIKFIQHAEKQETCNWGYGKKVLNSDLITIDDKEITNLEMNISTGESNEQKIIL